VIGFVGEEQPHESVRTEAVQIPVGDERDSGNGAAVESTVTFSQLISDESVKAEKQKCSRKRKMVQHAAVVTSSPYKTWLQEVKEKADKGVKKTKPGRQTVNKAAQKHGSVSKKTEAKTGQSRRPVKTKKKKLMNDQDKDEDDASCGACGGTFSNDRRLKNGRCWIQCQLCASWYHNECQGLDDDANNFICITCDDNSQ